MKNCEFCIEDGKCRIGNEATFCDWSNLQRNKESIIERIELLEGSLRKTSEQIQDTNDKGTIKTLYLKIIDETQAIKTMIEILEKEYNNKYKIENITSIAVIKATIHSKKHSR